MSHILFYFRLTNILGLSLYRGPRTLGTFAAAASWPPPMWWPQLGASTPTRRLTSRWAGSSNEKRDFIVSFSRDILSLHCRNWQCPHIESLVIEMTLIDSLQCFVPSSPNFSSHRIALLRLLSIPSQMIWLSQPITTTTNVSAQIIHILSLCNYW